MSAVVIVLYVIKTVTLTTGIDTGAAYTGSAGSNAFNAFDVRAENGTQVSTWTALDTIDGGAGVDTFNVQSGSAIALPAGATITGIEIANFLSNAGITLDTSAWTGLTSLTAAGLATTLTSALSTDVNSKAIGDISVTGGNAVTTSAVAGAITVASAAGAVTASTALQAAKAVAIDGGTSVTVNATGVTTGTVTVGATKAPTGAVVVNVSGDYTSGADLAIGQTKVTGGSTVSVVQASGITVLEAIAAATDATNNKTVTQGAVTVTGGTATTSVSVTQEAAVTKVTGNANGDGVIGVAMGNVTVNDVNNASTTKAGTISSVTLNNFAVATVNSGALTSLNLAGIGGTVNAGTLGALTKAANTALALNLNGVTTTNAVTIDTDITTLNVASTKASTIASLVTSATALNISGTAAVTITAMTDTALKAITSTSTAAVTIATPLELATAYTGGAGVDTITLGATTAAIATGAGNDVVTATGAVGKGGSVDLGAGVDTVVLTNTQADAADADTKFNAAFTNFEVLKLSDALGANTLDIANLGGVSQIVLSKGGADAAKSILDNVASGSTIEVVDASVGVVAQVKNAATGTADVLNLKLTNSTNAVAAFGKFTAANVETVKISTADAGLLADVAATKDTATLIAADATSVIVSGNNGLDLTNTGNVKITNFDASGVVADTAPTAAGAAVDTGANLGVTFVSANVTALASVTIRGGDGNDTLTGAATAAHTIYGGAGNDNITGGAAVNVLDGGAGDDTITGGALVDTISGGDGVDTIFGGAGDDIISAGAGNDRVTGELGQDSITLGAGRDEVTFVAGQSTSASPDTVTDFHVTTVAISATDANAIATQADFVATANAAVGGAEVDVLNFGGATVEADTVAPATGVAVGVNYSVLNGILTLSGSGASAVDTLGEWLVEASAVASTGTETLAFQFGGSTYVFSNGATDTLVALSGVTGVSGIANIYAGTAAIATNSILIG